MARQNRNWNVKFLKYMEMIVNSPNYEGLPIERKKDGTLKWVVTAKSEIGQERIKWAERKAMELGIPKRAGMYAEVMRKIHPTGWKVCQTCGREMSIYYFYPNTNFLQVLNTRFDANFTDCDHISKIWDSLIKNGCKETELASFLIGKGNLALDPKTATKAEVINQLEQKCRAGEKKLLGPGVMSNFPDRYDGFHTYNRCCRAFQDMGRSKENLKSYAKDRCAYEYWSDGNIHAANQFMGSSFFDGISADHIGPISLGFIHDPRYLQPMTSGDNSTKRDRLRVEDIDLIIETEERTGICPMSWQSKIIWDFIKDNYKKKPEKVPTVYRAALKQNMANYMYILKKILETAPTNGETFLIQEFLEPNYKYFDYSYGFNAKGEIIKKVPRHYTDRNANEKERYARIAIEAVFDYSDKDNRNNKNDLLEAERALLDKICYEIEHAADYHKSKKALVSFVEKIENRIIATL